MMDKIRNISTLKIESSVLCHNFINTIYAWRRENLNEYLKTYQDLLDWCAKLGVLKTAQLNGLALEATEHPLKAKTALSKIKEVRAMLYQLISAIADGQTKRYQLLLSQINPVLNDAMKQFQLAYTNGNFQLVAGADVSNLESPLWPILKSLQDMLIGTDLSRIRECPTCGWVFLDETKNASRKWCSPTECGTKDKMLRYNRKKKQIDAHEADRKSC